MSDSKRQCSKCQFFQTAQLSGNGWCTHPKRQVASDIKILVREKELACRNSWGDDLWVDATPGAAAAAVDRTPRKGFSYVDHRIEDEVTSVVDTTAKHGPTAADSRPGTATDDVVTLTSIRSGETARPRPATAPADGDHNAPAIADQAERARHMARGSKDAIQKARERHVQRSKPTRPTIAPESSDSRSDRVLEAQDRDHYARGKTEPDRPLGDYRNTPPVPRAEVEANGTGHLPTDGDDARFNRPARLDPNVDLGHLRGFLAPAGMKPVNGSSGAVGVVTSYDLVLKRALEIKSAGSIEKAASSLTPDRGAQAEEPNRPESVNEQPKPPAAAPRRGVVWDVGMKGDRLTIAFERARAAIDHPIDERPQPAPARLVTHIQAREPRQDIDADPEHDAQAGPWGGAEDRLTEDRDADTSWIDEPAAYDDGPAPHWRQARHPRTAQESPRGSWWRSLNFSFRRRYQAEADPDQATFDQDGEWREDQVRAGYDDISEPDDEGASGLETDHLEFEFDGDYADATLAPELIFATSEESWRQDERAFPTPQPVEWHETRAQLLQHAQAPLLAGHESRQVSPADDRPGDPPIAERPVSTSYTLTEPSSMDAFREALFGATSAAATMDADSPYPPEDDPGPGRTTTRTAPERWSERSGMSSARGDRGRTTRGQSFSSTSRGFDPDFNIPDADEDRDDSAGHRFEVDSGISKSCSTCRSFRTSDDGNRGWCMNDYAKTHRQMVDADDLACRSSIGDWWIATDAAWIPPTSTIQPETPRTDRLARRPGSDERSAAGKSRRVRTSKVG